MIKPNKEQIKIINNIMLALESERTSREIYRQAGALEGILVIFGYLKASTPFQYEYITVKEMGLFLGKDITRLEKYEEMILRKTREFLNEA